MTALLGKAAPYLVAAALLLGAAFLFLTGVRTIDGWIANARSQAIDERDAYWKAEIARSEAETQKAISENLKQTMALQDAAVAKVSEAEARASELEKENAALSDDGSGGLSRERVRLLNRR